MNFTVYGNQEDRKGNPIGYHRTTQGSYWNAGSKKYTQWKHYVVKAFCEATGRQSIEKPIEGKVKQYLHTFIYFKDRKHGDPDNIQKGIADALFQNDKYVAGSYDFDYDKENPRVEIQVI